MSSGTVACAICLDLLVPCTATVAHGPEPEPEPELKRDDARAVDRTAAASAGGAKVTPLSAPLTTAGPTAVIACGHAFHFVCINTWAERTNSCPSCRKKFNTISVYEPDNETPTVIPINDAVPPKDDNVDPGDYTEEDDEWHDPEPDFVYENCVVCSSGERAQELLLCDGCDRTFHVTCLGLAEVPFTDWYCPSCELDGLDAYEDSRYTPPATTQRPYRPRRRQSGYGRLIDSFAAADTAPGSRSRPPRTPRSSRRSQSSVRIAPAVSPPLERRRPQPQVPQLSPAEAQAWSMFEMARSDNEPGPSTPSMRVGAPDPVFESLASSSTQVESSSASSQFVSRKLKRPSRRYPAAGSSASASAQQPTPTSTAAAPSLTSLTSALDSTSSTTFTPAPASASSPTLIGSLLSDIRTGPSITALSMSPPVSAADTPRAVSPNSHGLPMGPAMSPTSPSPSLRPRPESASPVSPTLMAAVDAPAVPAVSPEPQEQLPASGWVRKPLTPTRKRESLTLERKERLQTLVRDALRPAYRSGRINKDQYTNINKKVSRALYRLVRDDRAEGENDEFATIVKDFVQVELQAAHSTTM